MVFSFKYENGYYKPGQLGRDVSCKHQAIPKAVIDMTAGELKFDKSLEPCPQAKLCRLKPFLYIPWDGCDELTPWALRQKWEPAVWLISHPRYEAHCPSQAYTIIAKCLWLPLQDPEKGVRP